MHCIRIAALAYLLSRTATLDAQPALVILVRQVERDTSPRDDPGLTADGMVRAQEPINTLNVSESTESRPSRGHPCPNVALSIASWPPPD
jgi:hypothetical protein